MASIDNVEDVTPLVQYVATAGQTEFDFPFPITENEDIVVAINGVQKTLTTDYSVSGAGEDTGGSVTLVSALDGGEIVTIYRDIPIERSSDFQQNGPLTSAAFNDELDKITLILQQLERDAQQAIRFPLTNPQASSELELSPIDNWENRYLYINADGKLEPAAALTATTLSQSVIGSLLYPRTAAEVAAGVTPTNYVYPPADVRRYGADSDFGAALLTAIKVAGTGNVPVIIDKDYDLDSTVTVDALLGPTRLTGRGTITFTGSATNYMLHISATNGYDVIIENVEFDCAEKAARAVRIDNQSDSMSPDDIGRVIFKNCTFKNGYLHTGGTQAASGVLARGGFLEVIFEDCVFRNFNRDTGSGTAGSVGCYGLAIAYYDEDAYCEKLIVRGGVFDTITNKETTGQAADVDCDGIIYAVPTAGENGNLHVPATMIVDGTTFKNCKGRNVKSQIDGYTIIRNFTVIRDLEEAINNAREFDLQRGGGSVTDGVLYYYTTSGGGTTLGTAHTVVLYSPDQEATTGDNADGGLYVNNLTFYNAIPRATDSLPFVVSVVNDNTSRPLSGMYLGNCRMIGGRLTRWMQTNGGTNITDITIENCVGDTITALLNLNGSVDGDCKLLIKGNINTRPANNAILVALTDNTEPFISGHGNFGFVANYLARSENSALGQILRPRLIGGDAADGHAIAAPQTVTLADDASHTFERTGAFGIGIITNNFNQTTQAIFVHGPADVLGIHHAGSASANISYGTANTNPDVDGDLNIWIDSNGAINIRNRLGSERIFHFTHIGGL